MIIPLELPPKIVLSGNPVVARLASNNFVTDEGSAAVFVFRFSADEAHGRTFIFSSEVAGSFTFTFKTSPDANSPTDLRLKGPLSDAAWISQLKAVFESNYYLERHYFVTELEVGGNPVIKLVAKEPGTASTIEVGAGTVENLVTVENTAGTNRATRTNFRVLVETYMKGLVNFRRKGVGDLISVDGQGVGIAQINAYLEDRLENQFAWPIQGLTPIGFRNHLASRTYLRYGESFGIPEQVYRLFKSPEFVTLQGRIPRKRLPDFFRTYNDLQDFFIKEKRFLTWQPLVKETFIDAPEKLFWLHFYENIDQVKIRVKRVLQDGTSTTVDFTSMFATPPFSVLEIDASAGIMASGVEELAELHLWLATGDNTPISVTQKYLYQPRPADVHYYLFENAWGAYDTAAFTGDLVESDDYKRELEERFKPSLFTQPQRRFRNLRVDQLEKFTVHSGYSTDQDWLLWLDDLFNSPAVFEAVGKVLHEVTIEDAEVFKSRSKEFVRSLSFTYLRQSPEQVYRIAPPSVILEPPVVDPMSPEPQFPAQIMIGDAGLDELYFPGNAWINLQDQMEASTDFTITAVVYLLDGNTVLFSDDNLIFAIDATGSKLLAITPGDPDDAVFEIDLGVDLRRKQFLIQVHVVAGTLSVYINGVLAGIAEEELDVAFSPSAFGKKYGDFGNFKGRLGDFHFGGPNELNNYDVFMAMAERFGLPVPGANWLLEFDEETQDYIFENGLTRTGAVSGFVQLGRAEMPEFDIPPGPYVGPYIVKLVSKNEGGTLHFTVDGSEPTILSPVFNPLTDQIEVNAIMAIKMIEVVEGLLPSQVVTGNYSLQPALAPIFVTEAGTYNSPLPVFVDPATAGTTIHYTIDGSDPTTESPIYDPETGIILTNPIESIESFTVKVISNGNGYSVSPIATRSFDIDGNIRGFMLEFTVSGDATARTITLPLVNVATYDAYVDWGDGSAISHITAFNSSARIHTYASNGTYVIEITGRCPGFSFNNGGDKLKLTNIVYWGDAAVFEGFSQLNGAFNGCSNCVSLGSGKILNYTPLTTLNDVFWNMSLITSIPNGIFDNCTSASIFQRTFRGCSALTAIPENLFRYNTAATQFLNTFQECSSITSIPSNLFRYNTAVTSFNACFQSCTSLTLLGNDLFRYNVGVTVNAFANTFAYCSSLEDIPGDLFRYNVNASTGAFLTTFRNSAIRDLPEDLFRYNVNAGTNGFLGTFFECPALQLRADIFYQPGEQPTRFLNRVSNFSSFASRPTFTGNQGVAPDLWNCDFGSQTPTTSGCYGGAGNSLTSISNYADIPSGWK